jgi:hypothetical protein
LAALSELAHNSFMTGLRTWCLVAAGVIVISLPGGAFAQLSMPGISLSGDRPLTKEEQEKRKAVDDAYKSAIDKVPEKKKPADPWGDMRSPTANSSKQR